MPLLLGLLHVGLVSFRYHVGSFDDDASYILTAKGLLAGLGLTGHLPSGEVVVGLYPPGYSAVLAPLLWIWPHTFVPLRLLSVLCYAAVFPLTWVYLGRRGVSGRVRAAGLAVLALGPPFATYGSMVMAETPFLVVLMLMLLALDRWREDDRAVSWAGVQVVVLAAALVWLKQAGVGLILGAVLWWPFSRAPRRWAKAAGLLGGVALSLVPVVVGRLASGVPLAGARYSQELGGFYQGGLLKRLSDVVPTSTGHLLGTAIPATIVPYLDPLPIDGHWPDLWQVLSWHVTLLIGVGAVTWLRRRDPAVPMAVAYLAESVLWPFVNERRAILILPILVSWYVIGGVMVWHWVRAGWGRVGRGPVSRPRVVWLRLGGVVVVSAVVAGPLLAQFPRDYLFGLGQSSSQFGGSRYAAILSRLGRPSDVVETDYRSSTALFTGHATAWTAFVFNQGTTCYGPSVPTELAGDHASYLLVGDLNKPGQIDNTCLQSLADGGSWAVRLLHTSRDDASVYELVGPTTGHPELTNVLATSALDTQFSGRRATVTWSLPRPATADQLSVGEAAAIEGSTSRVSLEIRRPGGGWTVVAQVGKGVGDGPGRAAYLLARVHVRGIIGVRVVVDGPAAGEGALIDDVAVIGPAGPTTR